MTKEQEILLNFIKERLSVIGFHQKLLNQECQEYADEYAPHKRGTKVLVYWKSDNQFAFYGVIMGIRFHKLNFEYEIQPRKKDFTPSKSHKYSEWIREDSLYYFTPFENQIDT